MKVFDSNDNDIWKTKVNFVDDNNVFVGYDMSQQCCEDAGWFISDTIVSEIPENPIQSYDLDGYQFDISFFSESPEDDGIYTQIVTFKIIKNKVVKYLNLYNCHNGYYSHGFEMLKNDLIIKKGDI